MVAAADNVRHGSACAQVGLAWLCLVSAIHWCAGAESDLRTVGSAIEQARALARDAQITPEPAAKQAMLKQAATLGIAALEAVPEGQWKPEDLQAFLNDMARGWLSKLPKEDQTAWVDEHATNVKAPSSHLVVGFMEWKIGRRTQALARAAHILSAAPDSFAASMAMMGIMTVHYHRGDLKGGTAALKSFIRTAPNNPMVAAGIRSYTWYVCRKDQPQLANTLIDEVLATKPDTKAGQAAAQMRTILDAIGQRDYGTAFATLETIETTYWYGMVLNDMVLTFVVPAKKAEHRKQLIDSMSSMATSHPNQFARPLAQCIMGAAYRVNGQYTEAAGVLEQVFKQTQEASEPLVRMAFELHLLAQLGQVYAKSDPEKAIPYLERLRSGYGKDAGANFHLITLGNVYLKTGKPEKAYEVFSKLEDNRKSGETIADEELKGAIQSGLVASLDKLGRKAEAQAIAEPLLSPHGYGQPASSLNRAQKSKLSLLLSMMDREEEAKQYRPE